MTLHGYMGYGWIGLDLYFWNQEPDQVHHLQHQHQGHQPGGSLHGGLQEWPQWELVQECTLEQNSFYKTWKMIRAAFWKISRHTRTSGVRPPCPRGRTLMGRSPGMRFRAKLFLQNSLEMIQVVIWRISRPTRTSGARPPCPRGRTPMGRSPGMRFRAKFFWQNLLQMM